MHVTRGLCLTTARTHLTFGKKVLASQRSWEAEFPPAATAVADALAKAGCTEFKANAGTLNLQDECRGLCARPCATPIPISRSGNPGPSSTRFLPSTPAHVRVILSLPSSFTVFAWAAGGGIGGGRWLSASALWCSLVLTSGAARKVFNTHLSTGIGHTGFSACGFSSVSSVLAWVPFLVVRPSFAGLSASCVRGGAARYQGVSAFALRG